MASHWLWRLAQRWACARAHPTTANPRACVGALGKAPVSGGPESESKRSLLPSGALERSQCMRENKNKRQTEASPNDFA